ncbi:unnamed protein product [Spodoptera littoralis]|uniref:Uncharacterized protein n=1 Tax=Spodoptera littoralis TaxID=7109 RepID=A0A9P0MYF3_SPOLI|nr:unnamed protein product [Spodoptera littoralis]CAH1634983.1 unnamed protein product [Spodoptera littoralis]
MCLLFSLRRLSGDCFHKHGALLSFKTSDHNILIWDYYEFGSARWWQCCYCFEFSNRGQLSSFLLWPLHLQACTRAEQDSQFPFRNRSWLAIVGSKMTGAKIAAGAGGASARGCWAARRRPEPPRSPRTPHSNVAVLPVEEPVP